MIDYIKNGIIEQCSNYAQCQETVYNAVPFSCVPFCIDTGVYYKNMMVQTIKTEPSYDYGNLIAEIGGTISLFLGLHGLWLFEVVLASRKNRLAKLIIMAWTLVFFLVFLYYARISVSTYLDQPIFTQVKFEKDHNLKNEFPSITFCAPSIYTAFYSIENIESFIINDASFNMSKYLDDISFDIKDFISEPYIIIGGKKTFLDYSSWSERFELGLKGSGFCSTFNANDEEDVDIGKGKALKKEVGSDWQVSFKVT